MYVMCGMLSRSAINNEPLPCPFLVPGTVLRTFSMLLLDLYILRDMGFHAPWLTNRKSDLHTELLAI